MENFPKGKRSDRLLRELNLKMKLSILLFASFFVVHANNSYSQITKVTLDLRGASVEEVINEIEAKTDFKFVYKLKEVDINRKISVKVHDKLVTEVLEKVFNGTNTAYNVIDNQIFLVEELKSRRPIQTTSTTEDRGILEVSGIITDENGEPLPGATILEKGTNNGVAADFDGAFRINVQNSESVLVISYLGYQPQEIIIGTKNQITVRMVPDTAALDEVVIVGYGSMKKRDMTGANSTITGEDLATQSNVSVGSALQGKMSGLSVISNSGYPGAETAISIRGIGSFGSGDSNPLIVVDGIPLLGVGIETLNPNDIASVSVLKDASSAAIYGSRAANGVIIVTTKEGGKGKARININGNYGWQTASNIMDVLSAEEFVGVIQEMAANKKLIDGGSPTTSYDGLDPKSYGEGTTWSDHIYETAPTFDINASVNGGTDKMSYYLSGELLNQEGIGINSAYKKGTFRANLSGEVSSKIKVGNNLMLAYTNLKGDRGNRISDVIFNAPIIPVYDEDGSYGEAPPQTSSKNAIPEVSWNTGKRNNYRLLDNFFLEYKLSDALKFRFNGGLDYSNSEYELFSPIYNDGGQTNSQNSLVQERRKELMWVTDFLVYFKKAYGKHHIDAMMGASKQFFQNDFMYAKVKDFVSEAENMHVLDGSTNSQDIQLRGNKSELALASYFGRINYDLADKYLFSINLRADGSSRFKGTNNRWGVFPSFAAGWRISSEPFFTSNLVNSLKVRSSWGQLGNQSIGSWYPTSSPLSSQKVVLGTTADQQSVYYGYSQSKLGNPSLEWETTTITNIGVDLGLLSNRVNLTANYFVKNTDGILRSMILPPSSGMGAPNVNYAEVQNKGFELEVVYKNNINDLNYSLSGNVSVLSNKIRKLSDGVDEEILSAPYGGQRINRVGEPISALYGYKTDGVITTQEEAEDYKDIGQGNAKIGRYKYVDTNQDGIINGDDRVILGSYIPKASAGLTIDLNYKNFDFNSVFTGVFGRKQHSPMSFQNRFPNRNISRKWYDNRWIPGTPAEGKYPAMIQSESYEEMTDLMASNTSFVKWKSVSMGYTLNFTDIQARLFVAIENPLTFSHKDFDGFDPENGNTYGHYTNWGGDYPTARIFMTGISLKF